MEPDHKDIQNNNESGHILALQKEGHTYHCASRQVWGDGECECGKKDVVPCRYSRKLAEDLCQCLVCLLPDGRHEDWCRNKS